MDKVIINALIDTSVDTAMLIPFLLATYTIMEWLEAGTENKSAALMSRAGRASHLFGAGIGLIPQCGFSAAAASLYAGGVITAGTLISVFLSTSDEMIPIFISSGMSPLTIAKILVFKFVLALLGGIALDYLISGMKHGGLLSDKDIHDLCERDSCGCENEDGGIIRSAAVHTAKITVFIFLASLVISLAAGFAGKEAIASLLGGFPVLGTVICGLVGLIPNCAASVVIAELYIEGLITVGQLMTGLLVGAGVGILVLTRTNRHRRENIFIIGYLFIFGVLAGILIDATGIAVL